MTAPKPHLLYTTSLPLAAVPSAASCARMFVRQTLRRWKLTAYIDAAELVISELVANAVRATGIDTPDLKWSDIRAEHVIGAQLRLLGANLYIEVWDRAKAIPQQQNPAPEAEHGRGLVLIEALAQRWDVFHPPAGGKVVWAQISLVAPPVPPPLLTLPVRVPGAAKAPSGNARHTASIALLQRVLDGLTSME